MSRAGLARVLSVPTPAAWLGGVLRQAGVPQVALARQLGVPPPSVNRWVQGHEHIPPKHLEEAARDLVGPQGRDYAVLLSRLEAFTAELHEACAGLENELIGLASRGRTAPFLLSVIDTLLTRELNSDRMSRAQRAGEYVRNAVYCVRDVTAGLHEDFVTPLVTKETVARHLRYPMNLLLGALLGREFAALAEPALQKTFYQVRTRCLHHVRRNVEIATHEMPAVPACFQHEVHLLARYGEPHDADLVRRAVLSKRAASDPVSRKIAFSGLLLAGDRREIAHEFIAAMQRDPLLERADRAFDSVHYGDQPTGLVRPDQEPASYKNVLLHMVRHVASPDMYKVMCPLTVVKLVHLMERGALAEIERNLQQKVAVALGGFVDRVESTLEPTSRRMLESTRRVLADARSGGARGPALEVVPHV